MATRRLFAWSVLLSLGATLLAAPAQSHKGDENSRGCHTDRRTGEYHCHEPKTPPPAELRVTYCYVWGEQPARCGHDRNSCYQLVLRFGGSCEQAMSLSVH